MRRRSVHAALLAIAFASAARAMPAASPDDSPEIRKGYETVSSEILCWCGCARQTVYECTCGMAHEVRGKIESDLKGGRTPEELLAALVKEHGEAVRVVPPDSGFNRIAWAGPGAVILVAGAGVAWLLVVWSRRRPAPPPLRPLPGGAAGEAAQEEYRRRLASDMSRLEP